MLNSAMADKNYVIKRMSRKELDIVVDWAASEGWNPGLYDADCFYNSDSEGFLLGLYKGEPVAAISAVKYGASFGFLGFYIVTPQYRGRGFGLAIWNAAIKYLDGRNIGLDGVVDQQENYKKSGFNLAYRNIRYEGRGSGEQSKDERIVPLSTIPFETIASYDRTHFPDKRESFIKCWTKQPESTALAIKQEGSLAGYGVIRLCRSGCKIGPLFANTPELAEHLFLALKATTKQDTPVYIDTPEPNRAAISLAERNGMKVVFETARMYTKNTPDLPVSQIFGVTTFELG